MQIMQIKFSFEKINVSKDYLKGIKDGHFKYKVVIEKYFI